MASRVIFRILVVALVGITTVRARETGSVPIIYGTDLHHPHMDPDDHFDLATLFAIPEFDVRAIVLDSGSHQPKAPGRVPVE